MATRRSSRKPKGTIKSYGDKAAVAQLLGLSVESPIKTVESKERKENDVIVHVDNRDDFSSDSLYESESDTFDSSEEMNSTLLTPSASRRERRKTPHPTIVALEAEKSPEIDVESDAEPIGAPKMENKTPIDAEPVEIRRYCDDFERKLQLSGRGHEVKTKYKPKTLDDYRRWKKEQEQKKIGSLGFDRLNPKYAEKIAKKLRQKEYGASLREFANRGVPAKTSRGLLPSLSMGGFSRRQMGLDYAQRLPKPGIQRKKDLKRGHVTCIPLMDVMKARHEREKALVDSLRQRVKTLK